MNELKDLGKTYGERIINAIYVFLEALIAVFLTNIINDETEMSNKLLDKLVMVFINYILVSILIFVVIFLSVKCIKFLKSIRDNKKNHKDRLELKKFFYQKILNDIILGISLEQKAIKNCQNSTIRNIYLNESLFYYDLAIQAMKDKRMFEINNKKREPYTDFLQEMNPQFLLDVFITCRDSIKRMKQFITYNQPNDKANILTKIDIINENYAIIINSIKNQIK
ncbi:hypothetical protein R2R35_06710 [Anaerocolumna sp. AGMB13020]|uniref:hypothetical protein n=1 Tax=Anaerocolumna sp. AGMB13020 TaxID=3081750 RepID=UPI002954ED6D|nr:hypothetical protein [Anaerocolumna sp. AGMB13020]WOO38188.1 hypothetical protein R2R35_06710 [Anaerocolumna sp. AGMB13020]